MLTARLVIFTATRMICLILALLFVHISITYAKIYPVSYDNVPISTKTWEEIDIAWYNKFNPKKPNHAHLLRPIRYIKQHHSLQGRQLVYDATLKSIRPNAVIVAAKPIAKASLISLHHSGANTQLVTGLYVHETNNVRTYRFINAQGQRSILHATPNHPFYVKQLHRFIPISQVTSKMTLVGKAGEAIHLKCPYRRKSSCSLPYHHPQPVWVYNIEVQKKHVYRVGKNELLVHNCSNNYSAPNSRTNIESSLLTSSDSYLTASEGLVYFDAPLSPSDTAGSGFTSSPGNNVEATVSATENNSMRYVEYEPQKAGLFSDVFYFFNEDGKDNPGFFYEHVVNDPGLKNTVDFDNTFHDLSAGRDQLVVSYGGFTATLHIYKNGVHVYKPGLGLRLAISTLADPARILDSSIDEEFQISHRF